MNRHRGPEENLRGLFAVTLACLLVLVLSVLVANIAQKNRVKSCNDKGGVVVEFIKHNRVETVCKIPQGKSVI